jgi:hypothetical protein
MITCPQASFNTIKNILIVLTKSEHPLSVAELKNVAPTLYNNLSMMKEFFLIFRTHQGFQLTENGRKFASLLIEDDEDKIRDYAKNNLLARSTFLKEAYTILTEEPEIDNETLGEKLNEKFVKQKWLDERTYKTVGNSCKDILNGFKLYEYKHRRKGRGGSKHRERHINMLLPYSSAIIVFKLLDESFINNIWKVTQDDFPETKKIKSILYANTLLDLGIGKYIDNVKNIMELTEDGIQLKNEHDYFKRQFIFQDILMKYPPVKDILKIIINNNIEVITQGNIGDILEKYNKITWTISTKKSYAVKFLNWLKESVILEDTGGGKYRFSLTLLERYKDFFSSIKTETKINDIFDGNKIYTQKIMGDIYRSINRILYSEDDKWNNDIETKEKIISDIEKLIDFYKSQKVSVRKFVQIKHFVEAGFELNRIEYLENCIHLLVEIDHDEKF